MLNHCCFQVWAKIIDLKKWKHRCKWDLFQLIAQRAAGDATTDYDDVIEARQLFLTFYPDFIML